MASAIKSPSDVDVSKIEFMPVKSRDNGSKSVDLRYEGRNLMLEFLLKFPNIPLTLML